MKRTSTSYYCDATGQEIEDEFGMLSLDLYRSGQTYDDSTTEIHLSADVHDFSYADLIEYDFYAYTDENDEVAMIEATSSARVTYYGRKAQEEPIQGLISTLESRVLADE